MNFQIQQPSRLGKIATLFSWIKEHSSLFCGGGIQTFKAANFEKGNDDITVLTYFMGKLNGLQRRPLQLVKNFPNEMMAQRSFSRVTRR